MLNLKLAELFADVVLRTSRFDSTLKKVKSGLDALKGPFKLNLDISDLNLALQRVRVLRASLGIAPVNVKVNSGGFNSQMKAMAAQVRTLQALLTSLKVPGGAGGIRVNASGISGPRLPGFFGGLGMGLGLPFSLNPQMLAGQLIGGGISKAIGSSMDIEARMAEIRRVSGLSADQSSQLESRLLSSASQRPGATAHEMLDMAEVGGRMGVTGVGGLSDFANDLAMVKNAVADMPAEELASNIGRVLNVFGKGTGAVKAFGSALTAMDNVSTATARDILDITQRLSGTAARIGITIPQVTALASVLKDVGLSNEVAGSAFSQIFRKMGSDSQKFAAAAGLDADKFAKAYEESPLKALGMVIDRFKEMSSTIEGQEFLADLGLKGVRTAGALQQLAAKFEEVGNRSQTAEGEMNTLNALLTANEIKGKTAKVAIENLIDAITALGNTFAKGLNPHIAAGANALSEFLSMVNIGVKTMFQPNDGRLPMPFGEGVIQGLLGGSPAEKAKELFGKMFGSAVEGPGGKGKANDERELPGGALRGGGFKPRGRFSDAGLNKGANPNALAEGKGAGADEFGKIGAGSKELFEQQERVRELQERLAERRKHGASITDSATFTNEQQKAILEGRNDRKEEKLLEDANKKLQELVELQKKSTNKQIVGAKLRGPA